jgi:hypothetical protein
MPQVCAEAPDGKTTCVRVNQDGTLESGLPSEVLAPKPSTVNPQWTVGIGWYVYLYLNESDIEWLVGLGYAGASAVICDMLVETVVGVFVCGAGAYIIWEVVVKQFNTGWIPSGSCLELKFRSGYEGAHVVKKNC